MKRTWLGLLFLTALMAGCGGSRIHVGPLVEEFDRYEKDIEALEPGPEGMTLLETGQAKRGEAGVLLEKGKERDAYPLMKLALADARVALASARMQAAQKRADECLREVEQARKKWEDAIFVLEQTETFLGRQTSVSRTAPEMETVSASPLPPTTLTGDTPPWDSPPAALDAWNQWRSAASERQVTTADLETTFTHHHGRAQEKGVKGELRSQHLYLAGRAVQELECRVQENAANQLCNRTTKLAARFSEALEEALQATLRLERGLQDDLRAELDLTRGEALNRQNQLFEALAQLEGKYAQITRNARGTIVSLADILFDFDKATLRRNVEFSLVKVATILNQFPEMHIAIEGHTDNIGTDEYNMDLSERRAKAVHEFLISQDVFEGRMTYDGFGESRPVADNATDEGRQKNRRVDLVINEGP